jgi:hypothetical protein
VKVRTGASLVALALAAFALGCGSSDGDTKSSEEAEHAATPQQAVAEIGEVRSGLQAALASYKAGDRSAAAEQVGDTYLQHFELVEGPLEDVDGELKEELEDTIREELREQMRDGAPTARVQALVSEIETKLDRAQRKLES